MNNRDNDKLLNSNYDGIQEYDNDLPRWWQALFLITVIFAVIYTFYMHMGSGKTGPESLEIAMAELNQMKEATAAKNPVPVITEEGLLVLTKDQTALSNGKAVFAARCLACHGANGEGLIGPNLTDNAWIHGGKITDLHNVVVKGVLEKGMLAWKGVITDDEINHVVAYVWTLNGTNPPNPKAPQGTVVERSK